MNMDNAVSNNTEKTMSSREIAELTGKSHKNVTRDISVMCDDLEIDCSGLSRDYIAGNGQVYREFNLNRELTDCLLTGYSAKMRMAVIKRWYELEKQVAGPQLPDFTNPVEAARAWADGQEKLQLETAQRQIAEDRRDSLQRTVGQHQHSIARFARTFKDLNSQRTKADLFDLGYFYRKGGTYRVYRTLYEFFAEKINEEHGKIEIFPTTAGKALIADLRADGKLTKLKRYQ
jgi:hypothetical protein